MMRFLFFIALCVCGAAPASAQTTLRIATPLLAIDADNPYRALSLPSSISSQVMFDPMVVIDRSGQPQPWLVTGWEDEDSIVWTLTLRDGLTFSNGVPVTSNAVVESIAHMKTPKGTTETVGSSLANIDRAEILDDRRVAIVLKKPDPMFLWRIAIWRLPEPESWKVRRDDFSAEPAANTGPFRVIDRGDARSVYVANPYAWNPPAADRLELIQLPDQTSRMQALNADAIDIGLQMGAGDRPVLEAMGGQLVERLTARVIYVSFAKEHVPDSNPIHDVRVRRALNYAVNRDRISALLLEGMAKPMQQLVPAGAPGHVADLEPYPFDPERAKALLAEAGYGDGLTLSVRVSAAGSDELLVYQQIAEDLRQVGVTFELLSAVPSQMTRMMFSGDFRADMFSNFGRGLDPLGDFRYRSCLGQTSNYPPYYCDEESLEYIRQAQLATDIDELRALMEAVTRREHANPPGIFLWPQVMADGFAASVVSAAGYGDYYDYIPYHAITVAE